MSHVSKHGDQLFCALSMWKNHSILVTFVYESTNTRYPFFSSHHQLWIWLPRTSLFLSLDETYIAY
jgi:hypothetical protein